VGFFGRESEIYLLKLGEFVFIFGDFLEGWLHAEIHTNKMH
jgi:hypothetical protein